MEKTVKRLSKEEPTCQYQLLISTSKLCSSASDQDLHDFLYNVLLKSYLKNVNTTIQPLVQK